MIVRLARVDDMDRLVPLVCDMVSEIHLDADPVAVFDFLVLDIVETVIAEREGTIIGFFTMVYAPHTWNPAILCAEEQGVWAHPDAPHTTVLKMWRKVRKRVEAHGVRLLMGKNRPDGPANLSRVYDAHGFELKQVVYAREV